MVHCVHVNAAIALLIYSSRGNAKVTL